MKNDNRIKSYLSRNKGVIQLAYVACLLAGLVTLDSGAFGKQVRNANRQGAFASTRSHGHFIYVVNVESDVVSEYRIGARGALTMMGTIGAGGEPARIQVDPRRPYVYVLNRDIEGLASPGISEYLIGAHGLLHKIGTTVMDSDGKDLIIGPKGHHVYVASASGMILEYTIDLKGVLSLKRKAKVASDIGLISLNQTGRYIFGVVQNGPATTTKRALYEYAISRDAALTPIGTYPIGIQANVATDPAGPYVYVTDILWNNQGGDKEISEYEIGHGGAIRLRGVIHTKYAAMSIIVNKSGRYAYVGFGDNRISKYAVEAHGILRRVGNQTTQRVPASIAMGDGGDVYVANAESNTVSEYTTNLHGAFTAMGVIAVRAKDMGPALDTGYRHYAYIVQQGWPSSTKPSVIFEYTVGSHGDLQKQDAVVTKASPYPIKMSAGGRFAYQLGKLGGSILEYAIGSQGHLRTIGQISIDGAHSRRVAVDPAGRYMYLSEGDGLAGYAIGVGGHLKQISHVSMGAVVAYVTIDPIGRHLYAVRPHVIDGYNIGPQGTLTRFGSLHVTTAMQSRLIIDATGQYAYRISLHVTRRKRSPFRDYIKEYKIMPNGSLVAIGQVRMKWFIRTIRTDPKGPYLYVAKDGGGISEYRISLSGTLRLTGSAFTGLSQVNHMTLDPGGQYLYALHYSPGGYDGTKAGWTTYTTYAIGPHGRLAPTGIFATKKGPIFLASALYGRSFKGWHGSMSSNK